VNHIAIHPQGSFALVAHSEFVHVFALPGLEPRLRLAHGGSTRYAEFSPDGRRVATGCGSALTGGRKTDLSARLWSFPAGDELHRIETSAKVSSGAFSSDGARLAIGTGSAQIVVVDVSTGARLQELKTESLESKRAALLSGTVAHSFTVRGVAFLPGDRRLVSCSPNRLGGGELRLWDGTSYVELPPGPGLLRPPMESACQWEGMLISPTRDRVVLWEREKTGRLEVWALPE
jgi:WD40 repeat protein